MLFSRRQSRRSRNGYASKTPALVECLELRRLPAGIVTAAFSGQSLRITGDNANNSVALHFRQDGIYLDAVDDDTRVRFANTTSAPGAEVKLLNTPNLGGSVTFQMGKGNDVAVMSVGNRHQDETGDEEDSPNRDFTAIVRGGVTFDTGDGHDIAGLAVRQAVLQLQGAVTAQLGNGNDGLILFGFDGQDELQVQSVSLSGGGGADFVFAGRFTCGRNLTVDGGDADDVVLMVNATIGGIGSLTTGRGDDIALIGKLNIASRLSVNLGDGNDFLEIGDVTSGQSGSILLGTGNDRAVIDGLEMLNRAVMTIDGGTGSDGVMSDDLAGQVAAGSARLRQIEDSQATIDTDEIQQQFELALNEHFSGLHSDAGLPVDSTGYDFSLLDVRSITPETDYAEHIGNDYNGPGTNGAEDVGQAVLAPVSGEVVFFGQYGSGAGYGDLLVAIAVPVARGAQFLREDGISRPVNSGYVTVFLGHLSATRYTPDGEEDTAAPIIDLKVGDQVIAGRTLLGFIAPDGHRGAGTSPHVHVGMLPYRETATRAAPFVSAGGVQTHFPGFWDVTDNRVAPRGSGFANYGAYVRGIVISPPTDPEGWRRLS